MNLQDIFNTLIPIVCTVLVWFCRKLWTAIQELKAKIDALKAAK
jgi:hypothetical protein